MRKFYLAIVMALAPSAFSQSNIPDPLAESGGVVSFGPDLKSSQNFSLSDHLEPLQDRFSGTSQRKVTQEAKKKNFVAYGPDGKVFQGINNLEPIQDRFSNRSKKENAATSSKNRKLQANGNNKREDLVAYTTDGKVFQGINNLEPIQDRFSKPLRKGKPIG